MGCDSIPLSDDNINWGLVCVHMHFHCKDSKDLDIYVLDEWMSATKTHPACTFHQDGMWLPLWLDRKTVTDAKISPTKNGEPQRKSCEHRIPRRRRRFLLQLLGELARSLTNTFLVHCIFGFCSAVAPSETSTCTRVWKHYTCIAFPGSLLIVFCWFKLELSSSSLFLHTVDRACSTKMPPSQSYMRRCVAC